MTAAAHSAPIVDDRREIFGWTMYDWANSAFSTTVVSVFLGPYLTAVATSAANAEGFVSFLGIPILATSLWSFAVSTSVVLQVLFLPILGAIADYSNLRKRMLALFATIGALATIGLFFVTGSLWQLGTGLFILANLSFGAAIVFYNAFLPDIASPGNRDGVSSRGFALGYLGGGILLVANLALFQFMEDTGLALRINLASAGLWWLLFSQITFRRLRTRRAARELPAGDTFLTIGFKQLRQTIAEFRGRPQTLRYLLAYLIYNDGIQTVIAISAVYGSEELGMEASSLALVVLMVQFIAFGGAFLFNWVAKRAGTKNAIAISLVIWALLVIYAYAFLQNEAQFFGMGVVLALVLGGSQALSRSLFSQMIPLGQEAEFFSFYEISERGTSWIGPLAFGVVNQAFRSMRLGILSLIFFFVVGLLLLLAVDGPQAIREAGNYGAGQVQAA